MHTTPSHIIAILCRQGMNFAQIAEFLADVEALARLDIMDQDKAMEMQSLVTLRQKQFAYLCNIMADDIREALHGELAPCTEYKFLSEYLKRDASMADIMRGEFRDFLADLSK